MYTGGAYVDGIGAKIHALRISDNLRLAKGSHVGEGIRVAAPLLNKIRNL